MTESESPSTSGKAPITGAIQKNCCLSNKLRLATNDSTGFLYQRCATGSLIMSNIFLATSIITLAEMELGCVGANVECGKIYGFKPSSLIALSATVSGILSAFILPFAGAIIDYTPNRHILGVISSIIVVAIQAIQIYTVEGTWFPMIILQSINGFMFQVVTLASYGYLPEIAATIDEQTLKWYSSLYYMFFFGHQVLFLVVIAAITIIFATSDVLTAQISQGIDATVTGGYFVLTWYYFTKREAKAKLPEGSSLVGAGFKQVFHTAKGLYDHYPKTVGMFFLGCIFSQATIYSFSTVAITYINEVLQFNSTQVSIIFLIVLLCTIPGAYFAYFLANKTNPMIAFKIQIITFMGVNFGAFLSLTDPSKDIPAYVCGALWGFWIGWYYPTEQMIYSAIVPKGQESELAGFFLYCSQILSFLPPLIFTLMNEAGIHLKWGGVHLNAYLLVGLICFQRMLSWEECLASAKVNVMRNNDKTKLDNDKFPEA